MRPVLGRPSWISQADLGTGGKRLPAAAPRSMTSPTPQEIAEQGLTPQAVYQVTDFVDVQMLPVQWFAAGDQLVLERPTKSQRTLLIIVNDLPASAIWVNFDRPASALVGLIIPPGGNLFCDIRVPQNDIHIFSLVPGYINLAFAETKVTDPTNILKTVA
jgi:hypothetical protein